MPSNPIKEIKSKQAIGVTIKKKRWECIQPLHTIEIADALLKIQTVAAVTGLSESSIRRKVIVGTFPLPIKDGTRCTRWIAGEVTQWLKGRARNERPY